MNEKIVEQSIEKKEVLSEDERKAHDDFELEVNDKELTCGNYNS